MAMVLEDIPITNGKVKYWTSYRRDPEFMITTNSHQYVTDKHLKVPNYIDNPTIYIYYKTENNLFFSGNDLVLANNNIQEIINIYNIINNERHDFLNISA